MSERGAWSALLVHGAGGGGWEWNVWKRVLAAAGIAPSAPDLMPASNGLADTSLSDYVTQAGAALNALPRPRVVIGASLGGLLALHHAAAADALVLINPLPPAPWHAELPASEDVGPIVAWQSQARLASTRRALPDADEAACLYAFRHWRDESAAVLAQARAGVSLTLPTIPTLCFVSEADTDVPATTSMAFANALAASIVRLPDASHVGPLLGRDAATIAGQAVAWLNAIQLRH